MTTGTPGTNARQDPRQVVNTLKKIFNYNDPGIATGIPFDNYLPQNAFIETVLTEIVVAFNAGTTNVVTVGTVGPAYNNLAADADITDGTPAVYPSTVGRGRSLTASADVLPYVKYTQTGTAATTGQGICVIFYEGGWSS
jgi:hypothetical protein